MDKRSKMAYDQSQRQADAGEAQHVGLMNNQFNANRADQKSKAMLVYKQGLDAQIQSRQALKAYGNMTNVEKEMNKDELTAFKNFDNNDLSMVPG